jgi:ABC-type transport system involved in cytochrome c biogenesis permease subunit
MNTTTTPLDLGRPGLVGRRGPLDWLFAALSSAARPGLPRYGAARMAMKGHPVGAVPALIALGWFWGLRGLALGVGAASLVAINLYTGQTDSFGADLTAGSQVFLLKYLLSSQSAILWMGVLFFMSTLFYWFGFFSRQGRGGNDAVGLRIGSLLAWAAVFMALTGTMVRWYESHQIGPMIGHIPVSNLYEVFVLFSWLTTLFYLYYEAHYKTRALGAFVMLVVSAAVGFLLWYTVVREGAGDPAAEAGPAESWWMSCTCRPTSSATAPSRAAAWCRWPACLKTASARALWVGLVAVPAGVLALMGLLALPAPDEGHADRPRQGRPPDRRHRRVLRGDDRAADAINARTPSLELMDDLDGAPSPSASRSSRSPPCSVPSGPPRPGAATGAGTRRRPGR